jgi:hypothetical protein
MSECYSKSVPKLLIDAASEWCKSELEEWIWHMDRDTITNVVEFYFEHSEDAENFSNKFTKR